MRRCLSAGRAGAKTQVRSNGQDLVYAYKFRSLRQIEYVLDIILNNRLYCADWKKLNDPMEGLYNLVHDEKIDYDAILSKIRYHKFGLKVCSLSMSYQSPLLWAHYADGFTGVAIEVWLDEEEPGIRKVWYRGLQTIVPLPSLDPESAAVDILTSKLDKWSYEEEVRILRNVASYTLSGRIMRVIVGPRVSDLHLGLLLKICDPLGILVEMATFEGDQIVACPLPQERIRSLGIQL